VCLEIGKIESEAAIRDRQTELALLVTFPMQGKEYALRCTLLFQQWPRHGLEWRCLVVAAIEGAKHPFELRNAKRRSHAGINVVLGHASGEVAYAQPAIQGQQAGQAELIFCEGREQPALSSREQRKRIVRCDHCRRIENSEPLVVLLCKAIQ